MGDRNEAPYHACWALGMGALLGGQVAVRMWRQLQVDIFELPITRAGTSDAAMLGAGLLAGVAAEVYRSGPSRRPAGRPWISMSGTSRTRGISARTVPPTRSSGLSTPPSKDPFEQTGKGKGRGSKRPPALARTPCPACK